MNKSTIWRIINIIIILIAFATSVFNIFYQEGEDMLISVLFTIYLAPFLYYHFSVIKFDFDKINQSIYLLRLEKELLIIKSKKQIDNKSQCKFCYLKFIKEFYFYSTGMLGVSFILFIFYEFFKDDMENLRDYDYVNGEYISVGIDYGAVTFILIIISIISLLYLLILYIRKKDFFINEISKIEKEIKSQLKLNMLEALTKEKNKLEKDNLTNL